MIIASQTSTYDVPPADDMLVHINLWMFRGRATATANAVEVVISNFTHNAISNVP